MRTKNYQVVNSVHLYGRIVSLCMILANLAILPSQPLLKFLILKKYYMSKPSLPQTSKTLSRNVVADQGTVKRQRKRSRSNGKNGDVLISAVVSSYLLTHLHHVLQRAEYGASKEGRSSHAANFAQLRKVLCMDARSMKDASALGLKESDLDICNESAGFETKAA